VDGTASEGTGHDPTDPIHHLAKVRVAGSNPVFRSILPGQSWFFTLRRGYGLKVRGARSNARSSGASPMMLRAAFTP
jgi:hypothetical protein